MENKARSWYAKKTTADYLIADENDPSGRTLAVVVGDNDEAAANARLIATAPALYGALKAFDAGLRDGSIRFTAKRQTDSDPYHPANIAMCAAFDLVESEDA